MGVEVAKALSAQTILLIGPVKTKKQWSDRFAAQGVAHPFRVIDSKPEGLNNWQALSQGEQGVYFVGREFFHLSATSAGNRAARWSWAKTKPDLVIFDESHAVTNRDSNGFRVLKTLKPGFRVLMSGTFAGNKFEGMWAPCRWLWPDARNAEGDHIVDTAFWRWVTRWAKTEFDPFTFTKKKVTGERDPGAFVATLPCYIQFEPDRVSVETLRVRCELTPVQRRMYDQMEEDMLTWLDDNPLVADLPIVQKTRLRQISLAEVSFNERGEVDFASDCASTKIETFDKIIERHPDEPILFWTDSQRFARVAAARLRKHGRAEEYSGKIPHKERERLRTTFGTPEGPRYIVAVIAAASEGLDGWQRVCHTEVWCNRSYNNVHNEQAEGRLNRTGQDQSITRYELVAPDTADTDHLDKMIAARASLRATLKRR
jgi:SNF2 family DNA or RNA helicase